MKWTTDNITVNVIAVLIGAMVIGLTFYGHFKTKEKITAPPGVALE